MGSIVNVGIIISGVSKKRRPMLFPKSEEFSNKFEKLFFLIVNCSSFATVRYLTHEYRVVTSFFKKQFKNEGVI